MALRKQPRRRLIDALVVPQLLEEPAREQRVPILSPLALLDADKHPLGVDVRVPQAHDLAHAEAAGVRRHQQDAVLEGRHARQQPGDLLAAENLGQLLRSLRQRHGEGGARPAEGYLVEEA